MLSALAEHREIHLWLLHPCPPLWERLASLMPRTPTRRRDDPTAVQVHHRLLSSMGRDVRELQLTIARADAEVGRPSPCLAADRRTAPPCCIASRQAIRSDEPVQQSGRPVIAADDRSIQVHACHGRARQVDVLRDVILGLLAADPTLEPRDVLVMCPDIETFAPLISATFGLGAELLDDDRRAPAGVAGRAAAGPAGRPLAAPDQSGDERRRDACSSWSTGG